MKQLQVAVITFTISVVTGPGNRVMDGMHRVARALLESRTTIRARRFRELPEPDYRVPSWRASVLKTR